MRAPAHARPYHAKSSTHDGCAVAFQSALYGACRNMDSAAATTSWPCSLVGLTPAAIARLTLASMLTADHQR